ncbi:restriction endonuclease [Pseudomonas syringae]|uniref:Restriction endonuclease n=1 Tax=Pseudomonas syringae TaxID=317 RepID=A0A085V9S7_PSESX|nr:restriction endonuclease [Pseudomonas syringae]KFE52190.1 restriction endonuclease [Pseudomonas syringae]
MSRKKSSTPSALLFLAAKLPWWLSTVLAVASGWLLHSVAVMPVPVYSGLQGVQSMLIGTFIRLLANVGQFVLPVIFVGGAIASIAGRRKRRRLLDSIAVAGGNTLISITWQEFELLVGEALRRRGFTVQEAGGNGPDGGIDLVARRDGEKYLVQCKQWRSMQVGVSVVRELYGAMAAEGAVGGFVITSGRFTDPAREFASGRNLQLVDGAQLNQWITESKRPAAEPEPVAVKDVVEPVIVVPDVKVAPEPEPQKPAQPKAPACPHCKKPMVIKVARTGRNAGGNFWGCGDYPKCRGIRAMLAPMGK